MEWFVKKIVELRKLSTRNTKHSRINTETDLEKRINRAKKIIVSKKIKTFSSCDEMIFVENYQEVIETLGYKDTLGMSLFVRDFIATQMPTDICIKQLIK